MVCEMKGRPDDKDVGFHILNMSYIQYFIVRYMAEKFGDKDFKNLVEIDFNEIKEKYRKKTGQHVGKSRYSRAISSLKNRNLITVNRSASLYLKFPTKWMKTTIIAFFRELSEIEFEAKRLATNKFEFGDWNG